MNTKFSPVATYFNMLLAQHGIEYHMSPCRDGFQWTFPHLNGDVVIHSGSYYSDEGYLESFGMPWDGGDVSVCTPFEMTRRVAGGEPHAEGEKKYNLTDMFESVKKMADLSEEEWE